MRVILTAFLILAFASVAQATVTYKVIDVTITAAAKANDATLNGAACYDIALTSDRDLLGCQIQDVTEDGGGIYNNGMGGDGKPDPNWIAMVPALEFDSYVDMPGVVNILAGTMASPISSADPNTWMDYGDVTNDGAQTDFVVVRITLDDPNATGTMDMRVKQLGPGGTGQESFFFDDIPLPEPATMSLLALGGLAAIRRRR